MPFNLLKCSTWYMCTFKCAWAVPLYSQWAVKGDKWPGQWGWGQQFSQTRFVVWPLTFNLLLAWRRCLTSTDKWWLAGVRDEQSSSVSEKCACDDENEWLTVGMCCGWSWETEASEMRLEVHSLIRSRTGRSCGACWCLCTLTDCSVLIDVWTGGCCCCNGPCQWCTATWPDTVRICWWLIWEIQKCCR